MKIAVIQSRVRESKRESVANARRMIAEAAANGARMAVLPEMFACPYDNACFPVYAESADGEICRAMSDAARENGVTLVAGSIPEADVGRIYNTSFVFAADGTMIARHRKVHLFDINIPGKQLFRESDTLSAGEGITLFEAEGHRFGLCICFDMRFPAMFTEMAKRGAEAIIIPAAFNMTTGPMHWELLLRARAADSQAYIIAASPARDERASYVSYANSMVVDPWAKVIGCAGTAETIMYADIDFAETEAVRARIPILG